MGLRLCGIALEPFCPAVKASSASRTSVRCRWRISTANFSMLAPSSASAVKYSACRSRWTIWLEAGAGCSPSLRHTCSSTAGGRCANVPTAPEIFPTAMVSRARSSRARPRLSSSNQMASLWPNVMGSAWMPWLRPIITVSRCSKARFSTAAIARSSPLRIRSSASRSVSPSEVSSTSEDVIPRCSQRALGPTRSSMKVRKAITSCLVVRSISSMRAASSRVKSPALARQSSSASRGASPASTMPSSAASSTSRQRRRRATSDQRPVISCRLYRGITRRLSRESPAWPRSAAAPSRRRRRAPASGHW